MQVQKHPRDFFFTDLESEDVSFTGSCFKFKQRDTRLIEQQIVAFIVNKQDVNKYLHILCANFHE